MKLSPLALRAAPAALTFGAFLVLTPSTYADDTARGSDLKPAVRTAEQAAEQRDKHSARRLIGQDVLTAGGESLGQVKDLIIHAGSGKVLFALVGSGGILGVGENIRAVPFSALKPAQNENFSVTIARDEWDNLPTVRENEIELLAEETRSRAVYQQFGLDWSDELKDKGLLSVLGGKAGARLVRVTKLSGHKITNAGQEVGQIEDVLVSQETRRASVLIDPDDSYTGSDQKFIMSFDQISPSLDDPDRLTTTLTRSEFAKATPAQTEWWTVSGGYPYIWTGTGSIAPIHTATTQLEQQARRENERRSADQASTARPSVTLVRGALMSDTDLRDAARDVTIERSGETLVLSGQVASDDVREKIAEKVADAAPGWRIDNRLNVRSAAE